MQFCSDCGGVLNLFNNNESELCSACIQHRKRLEEEKAPGPTARRQAMPEDLLAEAVLSVEEGRIVLRAREGWELWSSPATVPAALAPALARARKIYEIRLRRLKGSLSGPVGAAGRTEATEEP